VRDRLLDRSSKDIDLEVFGLPAEALKQLLLRFGRVETVGESFTVYKVGDIDVALPRRESKIGRGHRAFAVQGDPGMPFDEAARRRDFTINAIGWDPLEDVYLDPFGGRSDLLEHRRLRAVDPRTFPEDSLRVLRAVQFAARFELTVDPATVELCRSIPLDDLPSERIWAEVEKLLLLPSRPSLGFALARDLGVIERLFPEMAALIGCEQEPEWHPEGDVWVHTLLVIDEARTRIDGLPRADQIAVMLGAVCHDFGKPATTAFKDGRIRSLGHEDAGVAPTLALLDRLNLHSIDGRDVRAQVVGLTAHHLKPGAWYKVRDEVGDGAFRRLAQKVDLELLARLAASDCRGRPGDFDCSAMAWFLERARSLGVEHEPPRPILLGRHLLALGLRPGPLVGEVLREVYERQLDGRVSTVEEGIQAAREILGRRDAPKREA
jgi:tRNA nucleotidyltransferase (CCA-adding enzyme)